MNPDKFTQPMHTQETVKSPIPNSEFPHSKSHPSSIEPRITRRMSKLRNSP